MATQADLRWYICRYEGRPGEYSDVAYAQEMANQAVMLESINASRLNYAAALFLMAMGVAGVIVQKRMDQRQPDSKVSDGQEGEPLADPNMYNMT